MVIVQKPVYASRRVEIDVVQTALELPSGRPFVILRTEWHGNTAALNQIKADYAACERAFVAFNGATLV